MSPRLAFAVEAAYRAGRATLPHFQTGVAIDLKGDSSPVTVADRLAERMIREAIERAFPEDGILGEEEAEVAGGDRRWVVDPIDGTKSFVSGVPLYATLIGLEEAGEPVLGVAYFPGLDEMVYAERGSGAFFNGRACRVSEGGLDRAVLACGSPTSLGQYGMLDALVALGKRTMAIRTWGDAYGHMLVATGRVAAMIDPIVNRWDICAVAAIVREAGGRFTDRDGNEPLGVSAISSNGQVHDELLRAFAG